jgi:hypothetical protein
MKKDKYNINDTCPKCESKNIQYKYANCKCCRTYEGNGVTCWTYPICQECGFTVGPGAANSNGGCWQSFIDDSTDGYYIDLNEIEDE